MHRLGALGIEDIGQGDQVVSKTAEAGTRGTELFQALLGNVLLP
jgi:hypothetical protein